MRRYQVVDERMEEQQIVGIVYFESDDVAQPPHFAGLPLCPRLREILKQRSAYVTEPIVEIGGLDSNIV